MQFHEIRDHVRQEIQQRAEEGAEVSAWRDRLKDLDENHPDDESAWRSAFDGLYDGSYVAPNADAEPSSLDAILALLPEPAADLPVAETDIADRMLGAWLGRIAGCVLGKPVEGRPRNYVDLYLSLVGETELTDYFPMPDPFPEQLDGTWLTNPNISGCTRPNIRIAERDDDIDYAIIGLHYIEKYGPGFTTENVAQEWQTLLPFGQVFTAERVAYRNIVNGLEPPLTATYRNPFREWIGAQIRADAFGYVNAGRPLDAAKIAYRDASLSHTANGIYGEMWAAAMIASAFSLDDPRAAIEAGLACIPPSSRLASAIRGALDWCVEYPIWQECWERAQAEYGHYHWVHTINNAVWVVLALMYGQKDFGKTISIAVRCGNDTDCNGATAGSVIGAMLGARAIPDKWTRDFNNTVRSYVMGFDNSRITDLAERTVKQYRRLRKHDAKA